MNFFKKGFIKIIVCMVCCLSVICSLSVNAEMTTAASTSPKAELQTYYPDAKDTSKYFKYCLLPDVDNSEEGCLFVVEASSQYGKCLEVPDVISGKRITYVKVMQADRFDEAVLGDNVKSMECVFPEEECTDCLNDISSDAPENTIKKLTVGKNFQVNDLINDTSGGDVGIELEAEKNRKFNIYGYFPLAVLRTVHFTNLEEVIVSKDNKNFEIYESGIYVDGRQKLVGLFNGKKKDMVDFVCVPECKYIEMEFKKYNNIKSVTFGKDLKEIQLGAFWGSTVEKVSFENCPDYVSNDYMLFNECKNLKTVILPGNLVRVPEELFSGCVGIEKIVLPEKTEVIGSSAFSGCSSLVEVSMPENLKQIEVAAFNECSSLKSFKLPGQMETVPLGLFGGCTSLETVILPKGLKEIERSAFWGCTSLTKIDIPEGVTAIREMAFYGCSILSEIKLPAGLKELEPSAFEECTALKQIELPESINGVEWGMFSGCTNLSEFSTLGTLEYVEAMAFNECDSLKKISFKNGLKKIRWRAFMDCDNLEYVTLPKSLNKIDKRAFNNCKKLKRITIKGKKTKLEKLTVGKYVAENGKRKINKKLVIVAPKGSLAQKYAKKNGIKFKVLK